VTRIYADTARTLVPSGYRTADTYSLLAGVAASILAGRITQRLLFGIRTVDPSVILFVAALFLTAVVAAGLLPARRAASVDPMEALRAD
jgi:ABC-type antimicrobial peptide transport system permease subunit